MSTGHSSIKGSIRIMTVDDHPLLRQGIATLIEVLKDSQRLNKQFVLFGLSPAVQEVFRLTHVIRIFRVFATEQEALETA